MMPLLVDTTLVSAVSSTKRKLHLKANCFIHVHFMPLGLWQHSFPIIKKNRKQPQTSLHTVSLYIILDTFLGGWVVMHKCFKKMRLRKFHTAPEQNTVNEIFREVCCQGYLQAPQQTQLYSSTFHGKDMLTLAHFFLLFAAVPSLSASVLLRG